MIQIPANLAQRILEAARIAALIHAEGDRAAAEGNTDRRNAGGAGLAVVDDDGLFSTDGAVTPNRFPSRFQSRTR